MSPEELAEIEARLKAATPGPWRYNKSKCYRPGTNGAQAVVTDQEAVFASADGPTIALTGNVDDPQSMADADFIAHAPTDIAALLAEVRRLTPAVKVARWGDGGVLNYRYTVLRANNNRTIAKYGYDEVLGHDPWLTWIGANPARFRTEPAARAHIEAWARGKGWEVRDA